MLRSDEVAAPSRLRTWARSIRDNLSGGSANAPLAVIGISLLLLTFLTAALAALQNFVDVGTVTIIYLIAVLFAAIRGGVVPAVLSALVAIGAAAFFFYPPIYDFRVYNPIHLVDLVLFIIVAVVAGKLATDVRKAKMREQADVLREALIGSVSHELRTPLSSIIGSASVLAQSPDIANNDRLSPLVQGLREEADRLNDEIQKLLDATRISSEGVRPHGEWVDPGDILNAAVDGKRRSLAGHQVAVTVENDLPLVHLDPALIERALGQFIENAAKYSPPGARIAMRAFKGEGIVRIEVKDEGAGFSAAEAGKIWDRFYRNPGHRGAVSGSGLGLWIARSLVLACGGKVEGASAGIGRGATFTIELPVLRHAGSRQNERVDE